MIQLKDFITYFNLSIDERLCEEFLANYIFYYSNAGSTKILN